VTATSRRAALALAAALAAASAAVAACGSRPTPMTAHVAAFPRHRPTPPPATWRTSSLPDRSARLAYPPGWHAIRSDPGTVSAAVRSASGRIQGYLNATPEQGAETLSNWSRFRPAHNREEGDTNVSELAAASGLHFANGSGSCIVDRYATSSGARYREIACIVAGTRATTVVVGAAPPRDWRRERPAIERAISTFQT
jgi:hypothetical protein